MTRFSSRVRVAAGRVRRRKTTLGAFRFARAHLVRFDTSARSRGTCLRAREGVTGAPAPVRCRSPPRPKTHNLHISITPINHSPRKITGWRSVPDLVRDGASPSSEERAGRRYSQRRARARLSEEVVPDPRVARGVRADGSPTGRDVGERRRRRRFFVVERSRATRHRSARWRRSPRRGPPTWRPPSRFGTMLRWKTS